MMSNHKRYLTLQVDQLKQHKLADPVLETVVQI